MWWWDLSWCSESVNQQICETSSTSDFQIWFWSSTKVIRNTATDPHCALQQHSSFLIKHLSPTLVKYWEKGRGRAGSTPSEQISEKCTWEQPPSPSHTELYTQHVTLKAIGKRTWRTCGRWPCTRTGSTSRTTQRRVEGLPETQTMVQSVAK